MKTILTLILSALTLVSATGQVRLKQTLNITITGVPVSEQARINSTYPVSESGYITMWKIGSIKASGLSTADLANAIAGKYKAAQIYSSPVFQVIGSKDGSITDTMMITVGGAVRSAGQKPWSEGMTLYSAVQAAGGETPFGATNRVKLYRNGQVYTYNLKVAKHKGVKVYKNDLVEVPPKTMFGN